MSEMKIERAVIELSISTGLPSDHGSTLTYPQINLLDKAPMVRTIAQSEEFIRPLSMASIGS